MNCPICQSKYKRNQTCSNHECILSYEKPKKKARSLKSVFWKTVYWTPREGYYWFKNRYVHRWDLVRTGLNKAGWADVDQRMELAIMNLVVSYVEDEEGLKHHHQGFLKDGDFHHQWESSEEILNLYKDIKVTLPIFQDNESKALTSWSDSIEYNFGKKEPVGKSNKMSTRKLNSQYPLGKDTERARHKLLEETEQSVEELTNSILERAIKLRGGMWT